MKSAFKFLLLSALVVAGKFAKPTSQAAAAQLTSPQARPDTSLVLVHQVLTSEPVKPTQEQVSPPPSGSGLITELF